MENVSRDSLVYCRKKRKGKTSDSVTKIKYFVLWVDTWKKSDNVRLEYSEYGLHLRCFPTTADPETELYMKISRETL